MKKTANSNAMAIPATNKFKKILKTSPDKMDFILLEV